MNYNSANIYLLLISSFADVKFYPIGQIVRKGVLKIHIWRKFLKSGISGLTVSHASNQYRKSCSPTHVQQFSLKQSLVRK